MDEVRICWAAFGVALMADQYLLPEQAFDYLESGGKRQAKLRFSDIPDIIAMRKDGVTWGAIGEIYDVNQSAVYRLVKRGMSG